MSQLGQLKDITFLSLSEPRVAMRRLLDLRLPIPVIIQGFGAVLLITVILEQALIRLIKDTNPYITIGTHVDPFAHAFSQFLQTGVSWFVLHRMARYFGGTGDAADTGTGLLWMNYIMMVFLALMMAASVVMPVIAVLIVFAVAFFMIYMGINFAKEIHGFVRGSAIFMGLVAGYVIVLFAT